VRLPYLEKVVKLNVSGPLLVEKTEDDFVLGVGLREEVLEDTPILQGDAPLPFSISDLEQDSVLVSLDLVLLEGMRVSELGRTRSESVSGDIHSLRSQA
jgi:hypothetical protein